MKEIKEDKQRKRKKHTGKERTIKKITDTKKHHKYRKEVSEINTYIYK